MINLLKNVIDEDVLNNLTDEELKLILEMFERVEGKHE